MATPLPEAAPSRPQLSLSTQVWRFVLTGGLGPTEDDVTRKVVGRVLQRQLILNDELDAARRKRGGRRAYHTRQQES